jgi:sigma-B regulation protein RsbU (phosphoserine phosphatase)
MPPSVAAEILFELHLPARPERLSLVRVLVQRAAENAGCGAELSRNLVIAVNEACMNVIQHAYRGDAAGMFVLQVWKDGPQLVFRLTDHAAPVDLVKVRPRDLADLRPGGLGVHFIREIMDDCRMGHLPAGTGNYLEMMKIIE